MIRVPTRSPLLLALLPIIALVVYYFLTTPTAGDFWWFDASRHAMNGVFLRDFLMEGGLLDPIGFSSRYYQQYPGINIGFYPPFFYVSSVPVLLLFGTDHAASQAVVALYVLGLGTVIVLMCRRIMDILSAGAIALCALMLAPVALWSRQVQLDVPALTIVVFAAYALVQYLRNGSQRWLFVAGLAVGLGVLTRVQCVFMAPVWFYFIFLRKFPGRPSLGLRVLASLLAVVVALPALAMAVYFTRVNSALATAMPGMPSLWSWENWTWYAAQLPAQIGYPALLVLLIGLTAAIWLGYHCQASLEVQVLAACGACAWLFFTLVSNKDPRFNLPGVVFLFLLAAISLSTLHAVAGRIILAALTLWLGFQILEQPPVPFVRGFEQAARIVEKLAPASSNVLVSAHRDGNFIYNLRTQGTRRDIGVRRADKVLVEINILREFGVRDPGLDQQGILALLDKNKVDMVVLQMDYLFEQTTIQNLYQLLEQSGKFMRIGTVPLQGETRRDERQLVIYRRAQP